MRSDRCWLGGQAQEEAERFAKETPEERALRERLAVSGEGGRQLVCFDLTPLSACLSVGAIVPDVT